MYIDRMLRDDSRRKQLRKRVQQMKSTESKQSLETDRKYATVELKKKFDDFYQEQIEFKKNI